MRFSNFDLELAERRIEQERSAMIARAQGSLKPNRVSECERCGDPISPARKRAMPSARHCLPCASLLEKRS